jgi:hypothetical protein
MTGFQKGIRSFYIEKIIKVCAVYLFTNDPNCGIIYMSVSDTDKNKK